MEITCTAPINIAVIKYWGKLDTLLITPLNSSISITLSQDSLNSKTSIRISLDSKTDYFILNDQNQSILGRFGMVVAAARLLRQQMEDTDNTIPKISQFRLLVKSANNFPTAAGLASSASGFCCLAFALSKIYKLTGTVVDHSRLARLGSGSACRSMLGGFVSWDNGERDPFASQARAIKPFEHWNLNASILIVSDLRKSTSSTLGMQQTVSSSRLFKARLAEIENNLILTEKFICERDFDGFAEMTMRDSNQFHAICMDTFPPIFYLTETSRMIIEFVAMYNSLFVASGKGYKCAYTFDAGPNAVLIYEKDNSTEIRNLVAHYFMGTDPCEYENITTKLNKLGMTRSRVITRVIDTSIGDGPRVLDDSKSLFD